MMGVLTNLPYDPLFDLDPWVGQRSASFRFALTNGVSGEHLGDITPLRGANLSHDTTRTIKRQLQLSLGKVDTAAINPISDRINVYMVFPSGREEPLGKYMFTDASFQKFTSGRLAKLTLNDEMFLVDQQILTGINGVGVNVTSLVLTVLSELPVVIAQLDASPFTANESWSIGANRGQILESLSVSGDWFSPWFDNLGVIRFIRAFNPADAIPDFDFDSGNKVMRQQILETSDLLTAPNTLIVISNNAGADTAVVGIATAPPNAPHSVANRGFAISQVLNLQLTDSSQAQGVANGLIERQSIFQRVQLTTAPDPRHDSYNVIRWDGANWLELGWSMALVEGGTMNHLLRKSYAG